MLKDPRRRLRSLWALPSRSSQNGTSKRARGPYKPHTTAWQKVDAITTFMFKEFRWTVKGFIRYFVTAEAENYKRSIETRKKGIETSSN
jgi:hypothetical protein